MIVNKSNLIEFVELMLSQTDSDKWHKVINLTSLVFKFPGYYICFEQEWIDLRKLTLTEGYQLVKRWDFLTNTEEHTDFKNYLRPLLDIKRNEFKKFYDKESRVFFR